MSRNEKTTWRVSHPVERDATLIHILRYEWWDTEEEEQGREHHNYVLSLDPEPHWVKYNDMDIIEPTLAISGLDLVHMGVRHSPPAFDLRHTFERKINDMIVEAVSHIADLRPPVEVDESDEGDEAR